MEFLLEYPPATTTLCRYMCKVPVCKSNQIYSLCRYNCITIWTKNNFTKMIVHTNMNSKKYTSITNNSEWVRFILSGSISSSLLLCRTRGSSYTWGRSGSQRTCCPNRTGSSSRDRDQCSPNRHKGTTGKHWCLWWSWRILILQDWSRLDWLFTNTPIHAKDQSYRQYIYLITYWVSITILQVGHSIFLDMWSNPSVSTSVLVPASWNSESEQWWEIQGNLRYHF